MTLCLVHNTLATSHRDTYVRTTPKTRFFLILPRCRTPFLPKPFFCQSTTSAKEFLLLLTGEDLKLDLQQLDFTT